MIWEQRGNEGKPVTGLSEFKNLNKRKQRSAHPDAYHKWQAAVVQKNQKNRKSFSSIVICKPRWRTPVCHHTRPTWTRHTWPPCKPDRRTRRARRPCQWRRARYARRTERRAWRAGSHNGHAYTRGHVRTRKTDFVHTRRRSTLDTHISDVTVLRYIPRRPRILTRVRCSRRRRARAPHTRRACRRGQRRIWRMGYDRTVCPRVDQSCTFWCASCRRTACPVGTGAVRRRSWGRRVTLPHCRRSRAAEWASRRRRGRSKWLWLTLWIWSRWRKAKGSCNVSGMLAVRWLLMSLA